MARHNANSMRDYFDPDDPLGGLSLREQEVLALIAQGKRNKEIAEILCLSPNTVKTYVTRILQVLDKRTRAELASFWTQVTYKSGVTRGLSDLDPDED
jgi:DNA-binding NarL/FixJ family response regulator